jgi:hypothetical protein
MNDDVAGPDVLDPPTTGTVRAGAGAGPARAAGSRQLERARRAEAARITALVQYMLQRGASDQGRGLTPHH